MFGRDKACGTGTSVVFGRRGGDKERSGGDMSVLSLVRIKFRIDKPPEELLALDKPTRTGDSFASVSFFTITA